jgi:hypothetical protein
MCDMRTHHKKTVITNFGDAAAVLAARAHGYVFANIAIGANHKLGRPAAITKRLWRRTKRSKWVDDSSRTDRCVTREIDVGDQPATVSDVYMSADCAIWTD